MYKTEDFDVTLSLYCPNSVNPNNYSFETTRYHCFTLSDVVSLVKNYCTGSGLVQVTSIRECQKPRKPIEIKYQFLVADGKIYNQYQLSERGFPVE